jgi:CGNR zinc finger/Putative stress-induced transcription regulator
MLPFHIATRITTFDGSILIMTARGVADLPLVGGHPALDLVNTVEPRLPVAGRHEHLAVPGDVLAWARRTHLVAAPEARAVAEAWAASPAAAGRALTAVKETREALSAVLSALVVPPGAPGSARVGTVPRSVVTKPDPAATGPGSEDITPELEYLSVTWAAAAARSRLALGGSAGAGAQLVVGSSPALLIRDRIAHAAVELLCRVDLTHLGMCPADVGGCGWMFIDSSRNRSRRWCTMDGCGSHAKARRLTERRRAARSRYR